MKRSKLLSRSVLFNGAAILISGTSVIFALKSSFIADDAESCSARYGKGTRMAIERNGEPLTPEDLQARLAGSDWGLLERSKTVPVKSGPSPYALLFDLAGMKADDRDASNGREGIGFVWSPRSMGQVTAACLAYSIYLPEGFDFGGGGRLPGLMGQSVGEETNGAEQDTPAFSTRYTWREAGGGDIYAQFAPAADGRSLGSNRREFQFPRGQWVKLEQEVVLNLPGQPNGTMRVWLDGTLRFEKTNVAFRESEKAQITGVLAEIVPVARDAKAGGKEQRLLMTPFEVRWQ